MNNVNLAPTTNVTCPRAANRGRSAARAARTVSAIVSAGGRSQSVAESKTSGLGR
jgi:hypothetical protein